MNKAIFAKQLRKNAKKIFTQMSHIVTNPLSFYTSLKSGNEINEPENVNLYITSVLFELVSSDAIALSVDNVHTTACISQCLLAV